MTSSNGTAASSPRSRSTASGSEWSSDQQRVPVAGRDEADMGQNGSPAMPLTDGQVAGVLDFANNAEIQQAQLAQSKSKDPHVLSFASMMIEQHSQAKQDQAALGLTTAGSSVLQTMSSNGQRTLATLRDKSGRDFDRAYLQAQVDQHQKLLDTLDQQLLPNAKNAQLRSQISSLRPTIERHLQLARNSLQAIQSGQSSTQQRSKTKDSSSSGQRSGTGSPTMP